MLFAVQLGLLVLLLALQQPARVAATESVEVRLGGLAAADQREGKRAQGEQRWRSHSAKSPLRAEAQIALTAGWRTRRSTEIA